MARDRSAVPFIVPIGLERYHGAVTRITHCWLIVAALLNAALCAVRSEVIYFSASTMESETHHHHPHEHGHHPHSHAPDPNHRHGEDVDHEDEHGPDHPTHLHVAHWYDWVAAHGKTWVPGSVLAILQDNRSDGLGRRTGLRQHSVPLTRCLDPPPRSRTLPLLI